MTPQRSTRRPWRVICTYRYGDSLEWVATTMTTRERAEAYRDSVIRQNVFRFVRIEHANKPGEAAS